MIAFVLNRNIAELAGGIALMCMMVVFGLWSLKQLGKSGYVELNGEDEE